MGMRAVAAAATAVPETDMAINYPPAVKGVIAMAEARENRLPKIVAELPDLMRPEDYREASKVRKVRVRLTLDDDGVEILGDSLYVETLENLLRQSGPHLIERSLCG